VNLEQDLQVAGDRLALIDCFRELLKNADRWVDAGGNPRQLALSATRANKAALPHDLDLALRYARIEFKDNGPGVQYEAKEEVFKPFVTHHAKGLGLGLALIYRKIRAHGGAISEKGVPGEGACFQILLPLVNKPNPKGLEFPYAKASNRR
jgi:two-component system nitrogen regulation sensor histidine kinase GlnL